ncbi:MAG: hypothetical protein PHE50_06770 [Dehalococcoidales bacterium]|nr:hypothetical protein [Dehalococcoidales bacterium]
MDEYLKQYEEIQQSHPDFEMDYETFIAGMQDFLDLVADHIEQTEPYAVNTIKALRHSRRSF